MGDKKSNTIKCNDIEVLRKLLELLGFSSTTKPNGQVVHSRDGEVVNTYETKTVMFQCKEETESAIRTLVDGINQLTKDSEKE
ncbi:hypothetical protein [Helicobacter pylori]|uniref:hypothetical protein n=1 Tax=Helicobacter pylori TaxID=210 RepID=UPI001D0414BA|nr:hypothetical protein [Helicobacter pylori]